MTDTPRTDKAAYLCHPWTLPTDHEVLSKFRLLAFEMATLERELAATKRLLVEASKDAERYRRLREFGARAAIYVPANKGTEMELAQLEKLDAAIDAAIKEQK
jgi:hypothetical protein